MRALTAVFTLGILSISSLGAQQQQRPLVVGFLRADGAVLPVAVRRDGSWKDVVPDFLSADVRSVQTWHVTTDAGQQAVQLIDTVRYPVQEFPRLGSVLGYRTNYRPAAPVGAGLAPTVGIALSEPLHVVGLTPLEESSPAGARLRAKIRAEFNKLDAARTRRRFVGNTLTAAERAKVPIRVSLLQTSRPVAGRHAYVFAAEREYPGCEKGMTHGVAVIDRDTAVIVHELRETRFYLGGCDGSGGTSRKAYGVVEIDGSPRLFFEDIDRDRGVLIQQVFPLPPRTALGGPSSGVWLPVADAAHGFVDGRYHCARDSFVNNPRPFYTADTVGWGARIARELPGYRLATEREIACLWDGEYAREVRSDPNLLWGSGRAWWLRPADFDGDRLLDVLALVVPINDPRALTVAAFHGTGKGYRIALAEKKAFYDPMMPVVAPKEEDPGNESLKTDGVWNGKLLWAFVRGVWMPVHMSN